MGRGEWEGREVCIGRCDGIESDVFGLCHSDAKIHQTHECDKSVHQGGGDGSNFALSNRNNQMKMEKKMEHVENAEQQQGVDVEKLIAEAEARGYRRGLDERASAAMRSPRLWENSRRYEQERDDGDDAASDFLANVRPGVWD